MLGASLRRSSDPSLHTSDEANRPASPRFQTLPSPRRASLTGALADRFSWFTASRVLPRDGAQRSFHVLVRQNARSCQEWGAPYCRGPSDVRLPELLEGRYWLPLRRYTVARLRVTARCSAVLIRTHRRRIDPCQSFHACLAGSRQNPLPIRSNLVLVRQAVEVYYTASRNYDQWPAYC